MAAFYEQHDFVTRQSVGYLLRRSQKLLVPRAEDVFADTELSLTQWIALKLVADGIACNSAEVARQLCHNSGATTRLIDQLEQAGLIERQRIDRDRRLVTLALTEAGRGAVAHTAPRMMALWNDLLDGFSDDDVHTLIALLTRLVGRLEADGAGQAQAQ